MLTKFFRQDRPFAYLPMPLLVLVLWPGAGTGGGLFFPQAAEAARHAVTGMPFSAPLRWLLEYSPWTAVPLCLALVLALTHAVVRMGNDSELFGRRNHMAVLLLPLLLALLPFGLVADPALAGALWMVWALRRAWTSTGRQQVGGAMFDAGLLLGLAGLFYLPYTFLIVVVWASLAVTRPFSLREYLLAPLGLATVLFLGWGLVHFLAPGLWRPVASMHFPPDVPPLPEDHWMYRVVLVALFAVLAVAVLASFTTVYTHSVMREKNIRAAFLAFTFAMALMALFAWWLDGRVPPALLAVPGALLLTYPLMGARKVGWADAALVCLLLLACWARWARWAPVS